MVDDQETTSAVQREAASGDFDVVHLDEMFLTGTLRLPPDIPVVVHHHKLDLEYARATGASAYDTLKLKRLERTTARHYRHHVLCSRADALRLEGRHAGLTTHVVPNGVDLERFRPEDPTQHRTRDPRRLLFLGSLDYAPNLDAIEHLVRDILPSVPGAWQLDIVGARPHPALGWLAGPNVRVVGEVDDVRPHLARAAALVVPLRIGGGSRLKIVEALAMGCPVISTGTGAEGLELKDGTHLTLAGPGARFGAAITELLRDPSAAAAQAARGRARVTEHCAWDRAGRELYAAWESACTVASPR